MIQCRCGNIISYEGEQSGVITECYKCNKEGWKEGKDHYFRKQDKQIGRK